MLPITMQKLHSVLCILHIGRENKNGKPILSFPFPSQNYLNILETRKSQISSPTIILLLKPPIPTPESVNILAAAEVNIQEKNIRNESAWRIHVTTKKTTRRIFRKRCVANMTRVQKPPPKPPRRKKLLLQQSKKIGNGKTKV